MEITYVTTVGLVTILIRTQKGIEIITEVTALQERYESTLDELEAKFPSRNLADGAMVTRVAPSPTGFMHF